MSTWTEEQRAAIERREGELLLDAAAGSGKTSVLVERFVRSVLEDELDVRAILTITFTDKAAAEMRERIRTRLRELGADEAARSTEGAYISTIHGFCARLLRANALSAGIDPAFAVLEELDAARIADAAFDDALERLAQEHPETIDLVAGYGAPALRGAISGVYAELRARGESSPGLPSLGEPPALAQLLAELHAAAATLALELGAIDEPGARVIDALGRLERCAQLSADPVALGELRGLKLPGGNGAGLRTEACEAYETALAAFRRACELRRAEPVRALLDALLRGFGERYRQLKAARSALDFEDLELLARDLLAGRGELRERYRERFARVMVDELQDTNAVQLELIDLVSAGNLFMVGDAQQSIYSFRHADVELFERRAAELERVGKRLTLTINFRSRPELLEVLNRAFEPELGERFRPLRAGREEPASAEQRVELLLVDREAVPDSWRVVEARALAARIAELVAAGTAPRDVVVLLRATTDMRVYERALEELGVPTYVIGGRGYWSHPQVIDLVSYLQALANPREAQALYGVLASPLVGVSLDALVVLAAAARAAGRDPWWVLREPADALEQLDGVDRERLGAFVQWFAVERGAVGRCSLERLIERVLERTGYDEAVLRMPGGQRRLANVRKLMRLAREHEAAVGNGLREFLDAVRRRSAVWGPGEAPESEAPVEGEALDAVRLMTIHRAKGLEFDVVCVADLGRGPRWSGELLRVGADGRLGLRLAEPGTGRALPALDYDELGDEARAAAAREERRLFYVAMTRARERLVLSGAAGVSARAPVAWIAPRFEAAGVSPTWATPGDVDQPLLHLRSAPDPGPVEPGTFVEDLGAPAPSGSPNLSYSALAEYQRCGYRFYVERELGLPPVERGLAGAGSGAPGALSATDRGLLVHALLERLDFRRPVVPRGDAVAAAAERAGIAVPRETDEISSLVERFAESELCSRLGRARQVRREQRFAFLLGPALLAGALDVIAREPGGSTLVVDYKTDRLTELAPEAIVEQAYTTQRLVYALAALRTGAERVEVVHVFLERPDEPVSASFTRNDAASLEAELAAVAEGVGRREFRVSDTPGRELCHGCPAEGGLCSWPLELTRRSAVLDQDLAPSDEPLRLF